MAVIRVVRARDGDTLCSIAIDNGFKNCTKLRSVNPELANRQVRAGDNVNIPELTQKQVAGQTELRHKFKVKGKKQRVYIIQDHNRPTPVAALSNVQRALCVSNYVPTRQGTGFTAADWRDHNFFGYDAGASADPDHFKLQVFDQHAQARGDTQVELTLQAQKPILNASEQIERWEDMTEAGTKLEHIVCRQVEANSPWYRSHYLRLVIDTQDQTAKRPHGRTSPTADGGADVSRQTLVVPNTTDQRVEILDLRVMTFMPAPECEQADPARCRSIAMANVGKDEQVLRIKVFRIGGAAGSGISDAQVNTMIFTNYRLTLAQANIGVSLVDNRVHDVPEPNNMIVVSDFAGVKASGGGTMRVIVALSSGNVTVTLTTNRKDTPQETAQRLATALTAQHVTCRVSPNPPVQSSSNNFGSCDILCFNADGSPARIISATSSDTDQKLASSGLWGRNPGSGAPANDQINNPETQYGTAGGRSSAAQMVGSIDYRAACKNYNTGTNHLCVILVNGFKQATLLGEALLPYRAVVGRLRPLRQYSMCVFLDQGGASRRTVLTHEAGHVLLDAFHTTNSPVAATPSAPAQPEQDFSNNAYDNNTQLAFSEWMSAINREPTLIHKRMSDDPLTVQFAVVRSGVNNLQAVIQTLGGPNPSPVRRFRTLSAFVLGNLRPLNPAPGAQL
jgi:hypothetical protein